MIQSLPISVVKIFVLVTGLFLTVTSTGAGPLAGGGKPTDAESAVAAPGTATSMESSVENISSQPRPAGADELVSSYVESLRKQMLPDLASPTSGLEGLVNLDGLEGWSLEEISDAMNAIATGANNTTFNSIGNRSLQSGDLIVTVEDLYAFNAGYYFVLEGQNPDSEDDRLVSGADL